MRYYRLVLWLFALFCTLVPFGYAQEVQILAYNVFLRPGVVGVEDYREQRFPELVEAIRRYDIMGLSEVFDDECREEMIKRLKSTHPYVVEPPESNNPFLQDGGITLFSRYQILFAKKMIYEDAEGWDAMSEKGAIFVRLLLPDGSIIEVVLTHTQADAEQFAVRQKQFNQLRQFIQQHHQAGLPLFIIGDCNVIGDKTDEYNDMLTRLGAPQDVYRTLHSEPGYTWNGPENPLAGGNSLERLDYILLQHASNTSMLQCDFNRFPMVHAVGKAKYMSDHYGLSGIYTSKSNNFRNFGAGNTPLTLVMRLPVTIPRDLPVQLTVCDAAGVTHQHSCDFAAQTMEQRVTFSNIESGRVLLRVTVEGRVVHKFLDTTAGEDHVVVLPYGAACYQYTCPIIPQEIPASLTLQGECFWQQPVASGEHVYLPDLPAGAYHVSLKIGYRTLSQDIVLGSGARRIPENFVSGTQVRVSGTLPPGTEQVYLCAKDNTSRYQRAFVRDNRFHIMGVARGEHYLLLRQRNQLVTRWTVLPVTLRQDLENMDLTDTVNLCLPDTNHFILQNTNASALVYRMETGNTPVWPEVLHRRDLLSLSWRSWIQLQAGEELCLVGYPQGHYHFASYMKTATGWKLEKVTSIRASGATYSVKRK